MIPQDSEEWAKARLGKCTASRVADVIARTKSGYGMSRANYMAELVAERLTGEQFATYTNAAMQWGVDTEPQARVAYEFMESVKVDPAGFVEHPHIGMAGASPDGFVGEDGLVEIKCPKTATHIETLLGSSIPDKYVVQMQWQMACTGRKWVDFVSFDPRMPESMALFIKRVHRDEDRIIDLGGEVIAFLVEVEERVKQLNERYGAKDAA
jgi:putative phage-type endonuclease